MARRSVRPLLPAASGETAAHYVELMTHRFFAFHSANGKTNPIWNHPNKSQCLNVHNTFRNVKAEGVLPARYSTHKLICVETNVRQ